MARAQTARGASDAESTRARYCGIELCSGQGPGALEGRKALKAAEDAIDAVVCAFCAASWLELGASGNEIIGSPGHGMMIFPKRDH